MGLEGFELREVLRLIGIFSCVAFCKVLKIVANFLVKQFTNGGQLCNIILTMNNNFEVRI